ncbi:putative Mg-dependent DNase [Seiridium cardinale]
MSRVYPRPVNESRIIAKGRYIRKGVPSVAHQPTPSKRDGTESSTTGSPWSLDSAEEVLLDSKNVLSGTLEARRRILATAKEFPGFYSGKQYHAPDFPNTLDRALTAGVEKVMSTEDPCPLKAFGKLGLDYDRLNHAGKGTQITTFKAQLDMFVEEKWDLPLFLYCRASFDDFVQVIGP